MIASLDISVKFDCVTSGADTDMVARVEDKYVCHFEVCSSRSLGGAMAGASYVARQLFRTRRSQGFAQQASLELSSLSLPPVTPTCKQIRRALSEGLCLGTRA